MPNTSRGQDTSNDRSRNQGGANQGNRSQGDNNQSKRSQGENSSQSRMATGGQPGGGRGFAGMDDERQREIASQGGRAAHESGRAHEFTTEEAREAGRKGGETVSQDREHMAETGRKGGEARGGGASHSEADNTDSNNGRAR